MSLFWLLCPLRASKKRSSPILPPPLERIQTIQMFCNPTAEEIRAGINKMNFGVFGMIDWYARRMGITDHEEVMSVPWVRVYKCLDMDSQTNEYHKRLTKIRNDEYRRRKNT